MKKSLILCFMFFSLIAIGQTKDFVIQWEGTQVLENEFGKIEIPKFQKSNFNYDPQQGLIYFAQWEANGGNIDVSSVNLVNVVYESVSNQELKDLNRNLIPREPKLKVSNIKARNKRSYYLELYPIIKDNNNRFRRIKSFSIQYSTLASRNVAMSSNQAVISNSVLSTGEWYKFYIEKSGIYRISRSFLSNLGINVGSIDPRNLKIYGNGGRMIPLLNSENYPFDPVENAIKLSGQEDGSFDNGDYILFYGEGPDRYSEESSTNINLYTDKTYYYVNISGGLGKRVQNLPVIDAEPDITINTFEDYQYYEVDEYNLAKLGRRWFGDKFDIENERSYEFEFPNLIQSEPIDLTVAVGAVAELATSMSVSVNGNQVANLGLNPIIGGSVLGSAASFSQPISVSSDNITVNLEYNNGGNPSASGYLDYIILEAMRTLEYAGNQLVFKNSAVNATPGVAQYNLGNAANVDEIWDITDRFNVSVLQNSDNASDFSFKVASGEERTYVAFSLSDALEPLIDSRRTVANQNLKGTIFNSSQGTFQDIDYIILAPSQFLGQAERLAQINRNQYGLNVKVVDLQTIYNEFSMGSQDIAALRNFIKYVYDNASSPNNRLKYVCLFGDGSYDYKDRIPNNTNLVPSWYSNNSFNLTSSFVSDDFFGMMDENEGDMDNADRLDIAVGRILAENPQRAKEMIDKIQAYYEEGSFGVWRNNLLLISDDVDIQWERILQETTDGIGTTVGTEKTFINIMKIHSDAYEQESSAAGDRYPKVNKAIKDAIEVGALVVNYFGHGGEDGLAKERIYDKFDAQEVNNNCKFNLFITVTCEYTKFDDPNRPTAGEFTFWNTNGGAVGLITTTRQIFVTVGVNYNETLDDYLFALDGGEYPSIGEALRLTKIDPVVAGSSQKRLVFLIGDPAMKLAFPTPNIRLTKVNDVDISQSIDTLKALSYTKLTGEVTDGNGNLLSNYNGILTATVFDKKIQRQTLGNDGVSDNNGLILMDFDILGEILFKGQATVENGQFEFDFVVPRDIGIPVGNGRVNFYSKTNGVLLDKAGTNLDILVGGINENAPEDNIGPVINLFMNDENFVSGGITNESPTFLAKLQDDNGINTASGIGHDITAILDGDETNPFVLNDYYQANVDDYTNGTVTYPFRDLEPGPHTLTLKAWDVYNNSSTAEIQFTVYDQDEELVIDNVLNYPNPFVNYTEFWFNHNSVDPLDISVQIFTISGKLVRTLNGQTAGGSKSTSSLSKDIIWDGRDDFGDKIGKGVYIYKLKVKSNRLNKQVEKIEKLVIL